MTPNPAFVVRAGLSNAACYSFESRNFPGRYLRHRGYRVYNEANTGGTFAADATFCARPGLSGGGTSLESANMPGYFLRHRNSEVWMDPNAGGSFANDATWNVVAGWWRSGCAVDQPHQDGEGNEAHGEKIERGLAEVEWLDSLRDFAGARSLGRVTGEYHYSLARVHATFTRSIRWQWTSSAAPASVTRVPERDSVRSSGR